jgi:serine/threonine-protein kinase
LVLRVARSEGALWLEPLPSGRVSAPLSPADVDALANALSALHAEGVAHGQVDREHVRVDERGRITLAFTAHAAPMSTPDRDRVALARLARGDTDGA